MKNRKIIAIAFAILSIVLMIGAVIPPAVRERIAIYAREDSWIANGFDIIWYTGNLTGESARIDGANGAMVLTAPTAVGTATPILRIENDGVSNSLEIRNPGGTPVFYVDVDGNATYTGFSSGGGEVAAPVRIAAATAIATATPAVVVDSLGVSNLFEIRDAATPVAAVNNGGNWIFGTVDGTGVDVTWYSDTAGDTMLWDQSEEALTITGTNGQDALNVDDGNVDIDDDVDVNGTANLDVVDIDGVTNLITNTEHIGVMSILKSNVITTTNGAIFTIGAGEIWWVQGIFVEVTTNFDCTGDDCTLTIGDGNDTDGFLTLADAELQAADTEGTGFSAGWQGMTDAVIGDYLDATLGQGFVYDEASEETIDIAIDDTGGTNPSAGAATVWLFYTRIQ